MHVKVFIRVTFCFLKPRAITLLFNVFLFTRDCVVCTVHQPGYYLHTWRVKNTRSLQEHNVKRVSAADVYAVNTIACHKNLPH